MAKNEEGEFELVLGNRQLVSVFLIVVILLGVFFSMGYIVGRNSSPAMSAEAGGRNSAASKPIVVDNPSRTAQRPAESAADTKPSPTPVEPVPEPRSEEPKSRESKRPEPAPEPPKREAPKPAPSAPTSVSNEEPRPGQTFLQVLATDRADADAIAEMLAKRGFKAIVAPSSIAQKFRVLVGPTKDASDLAETRVKLEGAGFKPIVQRY